MLPVFALCGYHASWRLQINNSYHNKAKNGIMITVIFFEKIQVSRKVYINERC